MASECYHTLKQMIQETAGAGDSLWNHGGSGRTWLWLSVGFSHQDLSAPRGSLFSSSCSPESWKTEDCDTRVRDVPPASFQGKRALLCGLTETLFMMLLHGGWEWA